MKQGPKSIQPPGATTPPCLDVDLKPVSMVLRASRSFAGSTETYLIVETDLNEFWLALGKQDQAGPIGYVRYSRRRGADEFILGRPAGTFEAQEVQPANYPAPHPIVSLSGVLWHRPAALEVSASIQAFLAQRDQMIESELRSASAPCRHEA